MSLVLHSLFFFFLIIIYTAKVSRVLHPLENAMSTLCTLEITDRLPETGLWSLQR